jgi:hypothetical protein
MELLSELSRFSVEPFRASDVNNDSVVQRGVVIRRGLRSARKYHALSIEPD